jgi:hypothetical protein
MRGRVDRRQLLLQRAHKLQVELYLILVALLFPSLVNLSLIDH